MDKVTPLDEEYIYEEKILISQSDLKGNITYVNDAFCEVSGYARESLIGSPYKIVRHPDMPKVIFEKLWDTTKDGQAWTGLIKNLRSDGQYYWNNSSISPIKDDNDAISGFIACSRPAERKNIKDSEALYEKILASET